MIKETIMALVKVRPILAAVTVLALGVGCIGIPLYGLVDNYLETHERVIVNETNISNLNTNIEKVGTRIGNLEKDVRELKAQVGNLEKEVGELKIQVEKLITQSAVKSGNPEE